MPITFRCEHCHTEVKAPEAAAGKRGKCPHCGQSSYIPLPVSEEELIPLTPLDEDQERKRQEELRAARQMDQALLLHESKSPSADDATTPMSDREDLSAPDVYHFVVNFCLDKYAGKELRASSHVVELQNFRPAARQAVDDFLSGKALEPALQDIPVRTLNNFLTELKRQLGS